MRVEFAAGPAVALDRWAAVTWTPTLRASSVYGNLIGVRFFVFGQPATTQGGNQDASHIRRRLQYNINEKLTLSFDARYQRDEICCEYADWRQFHR